MSKWTVRKAKTGLVLLFGGPKWEVRDPDGKLVRPLHDTHAEALAHADRMARTVAEPTPSSLAHCLAVFSLAHCPRTAPNWCARQT